MRGERGTLVVPPDVVGASVAVARRDARQAGHWTGFGGVMTDTHRSEGPVTVLETGDQALLAVAKSLLEEAGIHYFAKGEGVQDLFAWGRMGTGFNPFVGPVQLQVAAEDAEEASALLREFDDSPGDE